MSLNTKLFVMTMGIRKCVADVFQGGCAMNRSAKGPYCCMKTVPSTLGITVVKWLGRRSRVPEVAGSNPVRDV
jgi:hypothetical protein